VDVLQFVHVMWCPIYDNVPALKFGCGFMGLCAPKDVLDFVHLLTYLQFGGHFGFVSGVGIALSAVLRRELRLVSLTIDASPKFRHFVWAVCARVVI